MHHKITCQKQILTPTAAGESQETLQDIAVVWAEIMPKSGDVRTAARQSHLAPTFLVRTRYQDILLATRHILWQGRRYRVVSLLTPHQAKRIIEMQVIEGKL